MGKDIILDSIADGVFTVDDNWRITSFNLGGRDQNWEIMLIPPPKAGLASVKPTDP
jgi:hypothetical protein